jgi:hypothetical protein
MSMFPKTNKKTKITFNFFSIRQKCPYKLKKNTKTKKKIRQLKRLKI